MAQDDKGNTALHLAAAEGHVIPVYHILSSQPLCEDTSRVLALISTCNKWGKTAMDMAVFHKCKEVEEEIETKAQETVEVEVPKYAYSFPTNGIASSAINDEAADALYKNLVLTSVKSDGDLSKAIDEKKKLFSGALGLSEKQANKIDGAIGAMCFDQCVLAKRALLLFCGRAAGRVLGCRGGTPRTPLPCFRRGRTWFACAYDRLHLPPI